MSGKNELRLSAPPREKTGVVDVSRGEAEMRRVKFGDIAFNSVAKKKPTAEDAARYIGLEHIDPGSFVVSRWGGDVAPIGEKLLMKKGDLLFGKRRAYQRKVAIAPFDGIFSAHGMVLRPKTDVVDERYFPFFIASDQFMDMAVKISVGGLSPTINWKTLKECEFNLPPLARQRELANLLWAANDLKESYKKAIIATDEMLKAKFREMFGETGDGEVFNAETQSRREGDCGSVSRGGAETRSKWPMKEVCELAENISAGKDVPEDFVKEKDAQHTIPIFSNSIEAKGLYGYANTPRILVPSITITARGTIGFVCKRDEPYVPIIRLIVFIPKQSMLDLSYATYALQGSCKASGVTSIPQLTVPAFSKIKIPLPPISLQREFVAIAERADAAKSALKQSIADIDQVMKGLING